MRDGIRGKMRINGWPIFSLSAQSATFCGTLCEVRVFVYISCIRARINIKIFVYIFSIPEISLKRARKILLDRNIAAFQ